MDSCSENLYGTIFERSFWISCGWYNEREIHISEHTHTYIHTAQQNCQTEVVDKDTYVMCNFGFSDAWLPMKFTKLQKLYKYYLWEGEEVAKHQLSICLAALLSKTEQHCRKNSPQTQDHHY